MAYVSRCDDINELHPYLKELAQKLVVEAKKQGLNIKVIDTYRSVARQDYLYSQGRTEPGNIVTNAKGSAKSSYHQWRLAFDCINNVPGNEYDPSILAKLGKIGQSIGLEWGGGWSGFKDAPHFQYTYGLSIKQLNAGAKIPDYNPNKPKEYTVTLDKTKVIVEGEALEVESVNVNGNNFVKLRSLESKRITIGYENGMPTVNLKSNGKAHAGLPLAVTTKKFTVSIGTTKINICGEVKDAETINIEGSNYIKLRSLESKKITIGYKNSTPTVDLK